MSWKQKINLDLERLKKLHLGAEYKKHNNAQLAVIFNCSPRTIRRKLIALGLASHSRAYAYKIGNGGSDRSITYHGYWMIAIHKSDPFFKMSKKQKLRGSEWGRILEHRYVMAKHIGRCLEPWEIVHHKNHNKLDNRIENLEIISRAVEHLSETIAHTHLVKMKARIDQLQDKLDCLHRLHKRGLLNETPEQCRARYLAENPTPHPKPACATDPIPPCSSSVILAETCSVPH